MFLVQRRQNKLSAWAWMCSAVLPHHPLAAVWGKGIWHLSILASRRSWGFLTPPCTQVTLISWKQRRRCWIFPLPSPWQTLGGEFLCLGSKFDFKDVYFCDKNRLWHTASRPDVKVEHFCGEELPLASGMDAAEFCSEKQPWYQLGTGVQRAENVRLGGGQISFLAFCLPGSVKYF